MTEYTTIVVPAIPGTPMFDEEGRMTDIWQRFFLDFKRVLADPSGELIASRIVATDSDGLKVSVSDLTSWIVGIANEILVTDDGDGTVTLGLLPHALGGLKHSADTLANLNSKISDATLANVLASIDNRLARFNSTDSLQGSDAGVDDSGNIYLPKTAGIGIKVDLTAPTFGWRDLLGVIRTRGVGATDPNDATYRGNIKGYQFSVNDEAWIEYHIPHDYVSGTDIHLHFHWSHNSAIVTGGNVTWGADVTYAKGHNQTAFVAPVNPTIVGNVSTVQYQHIITEVQISALTPSASQIDTDNLEPDGVILVRVYLSANNITSSGAVPDPFLHYADIHYQSTNMATKDKAPDFYT